MPPSMNRPRQVRTVSSLSDSIRAITALDAPSAAASDTAKTTLQRRVADHHAQHWPQLSSLDVRWRGNYAYIDAATPDGDVWQLCRLKWNGHPDHWEFAIYLASRDGYEPNILPSGWPTGTPEEAIDCAGLLYLNDWTQPRRVNAALH